MGSNSLIGGCPLGLFQGWYRQGPGAAYSRRHLLDSRGCLLSVESVWAVYGGDRAPLFASFVPGSSMQVDPEGSLSP